MFAASKDAEAHRRVFDEIVELLLSAGYFRARIAALLTLTKSLVDFAGRSREAVLVLMSISFFRRIPPSVRESSFRRIL